jgi:hypothetical protein
VRRAYGGWPRGDFVPEDSWAEDLVWHASPDDPDTPATQGRAAVQDVLDDWLSHLGRYDIQCEFIDSRDEVLVGVGLLLEGTHTPLVSYHACRVVGDKIGSVRVYAHRREALLALGLEG